MDTIKTIWNNFDWSVLTDMLLSVIPILVCIVIHELCHGLCAYALGDDTAKKMGRLTLNPLKHLDPFGFIMMMIFGFGYAKPVPVNMYKFKNPKLGMAVTALAGPLSNIILAALVMFIYGIITPFASDTVLSIVGKTATLSVSLGIFNLIPIPPLDGSKIVFSLLRKDLYYKLMKYERYGFILLYILLFTGVLDKPLNICVNFVINILLNFAYWGFDLAHLFM